MIARALAAVLVLLGVAPAAAQGSVTTTTSIGGLTLTYSPEIWRPWNSGAPDTVLLDCLPPTCSEPVLVGIAVTASEEPCPPNSDPLLNDLAALFGQPARTLGPDEGVALPFTVTETFSGCRARTTPVIEACLQQGGRRYTVTTGTLAGCALIPAVPYETFVDLLGGFAAP